MKTFIYSIKHKNNNEVYYIGSTTRKYFCERKREHIKHNENTKEKYKSNWLSLYNIIIENGGWNNFIFDILEQYENPLEKKQRLIIEQHFIFLYNPKCNKNKTFKLDDMEKIKIKCNCGGFYTIKNKNNHNKTKKHIEFSP